MSTTKAEVPEHLESGFNLILETEGAAAAKAWLKEKMAPKVGHTPGPWGISAVPMSKTLYPTYVIVGNDGRALETVAHATGEQAMANARLIAAAPELLDALKDLEDATSCEAKDTTPTLRACLNAARAAIAKAEGNT